MIPEFLQNRLIGQYGSFYGQIQAGYACKRVTTLRVNTLKTTVSAVKEALSACQIAYQEVDWYESALIIPNNTERDLQQTELYRRGEIYLQSLSSMIPPLVLNAQDGESVLDMTAAPGGKTTQISALSGGRALITACENNPVRFERLKYNVEKQGAPRTTTLHTDACRLDDFFRFDKILLDAPCSGSGTLNLNAPSVISDKLILNSVIVQEKLLKKALTLLKKGGTLVYSTCSILQEENENMLARVLPSFGAYLVPVGGFGTVPLLPSAFRETLLVCPNKYYEGFFVAKIQK